MGVAISMMAIWKHDTFPYFLFSKITNMRKDGAVETENYGKGHYFKPFLLLPASEYDHIKSQFEQLKSLEAKYKKETYQKLIDLRNDGLPKVLIEALKRVG